MRNIHFELPMTEKTYKVVGERRLKLFLFEPTNIQQNRAVILFFNGGSFKKGPLSPAQFQHQASYFASQGMLAICVDYRNGYDEGFVPAQAICDVKSAVRWVRKHSSELGIHPDKIVVCGASAGGYIAVSSIMFEEIDDDHEELKNTAHVPNALVVFAAVMDVVDITARLFPELVDQATQFSPIHNVKKCLPVTLWLSGTADEIYEHNKEFVNLMSDAGNKITFVTYEGMEHGFQNYGKHENKPFLETTLRIEDFIKSMGYL